MPLSDVIKARISRKLENSTLKRVIVEELADLLDDCPSDVSPEEYCTTVTLLILKEFGCHARTVDSPAGTGENSARPGTPAATLPFETILEALLAATQYDLIGANVQMVKALGNAIAERDTGTNDHNLKVTLYAAGLAVPAEFHQQEIQALIKGSFLHDIGKIGIPDATLLKTGELAEDERRLMNSHPVRGGRIIAGVLWLEDARDVVVHHHERWDGSGYPDGLGNDRIPVAARVFAIVDVFDALTSHRPYKEALSYDDTIAYMKRQSGSHFDRSLFNLFLDISKDLYERICCRTTSELEALMVRLVQEHFGLDPKGRYLGSLYGGPRRPGRH
ncbi:MAG TPA: HD-GYP domain-containing protein [Acidobacteriota bacterium]|nr:HD-GYP domain-containing protein [Acidobacteriota bacterium]